MQTDEIFRLGKLHNVTKLDDAIRVINELKMNGKLDLKTDEKVVFRNQ